jgi:hypothetical protein
MTSPPPFDFGAVVLPAKINRKLEEIRMRTLALSILAVASLGLGAAYAQQAGQRPTTCSAQAAACYQFCDRGGYYGRTPQCHGVCTNKLNTCMQTVLVSRANRMRARQGKPEFKLVNGQAPRAANSAASNGHPIFWEQRSSDQSTGKSVSSG